MIEQGYTLTVHIMMPKSNSYSVKRLIIFKISSKTHDQAKCLLIFFEAHF